MDSPAQNSAQNTKTELIDIKSPRGETYRQRRLLGNGSFGKVFEVVNDSDQTFALKMIDMKKIQQTKEIEYVITEQEIMSSVDSPHILKIHDQFLFKRDYILVTDYCEGGDLNEMLVKNNKQGFSEEFVISLLKQILSGFAELYRLKIIHRDLKLSNLLWRKSHVVIADFGLAKVGCVSANSVVGSLPFMAPEVLQIPNFGIDSCTSNLNLFYTSQIDVWSLGVCLYLLFNNQFPFSGFSRKELSEFIKKKGGVNLQFSNPTVSQQMINIVRRMLDPNPSSRITFPELFGVFHIPYVNPDESLCTPSMMIEDSNEFSIQSQQNIDSFQDAHNTSNPFSNAEQKLKTASDSDSQNRSFIYLDILIGFTEENKKFVFELTYNINTVIFFMNLSKEIQHLNNQINSSFLSFKIQTEGIDFMHMRKAYLHFTEVRNLIDGKPNAFNYSFPYHLFAQEDLQRFDMLIFTIGNKLYLFFSQKKCIKDNKSQFLPQYLPYCSMSTTEIDNVLMGHIRNCWFGFLQTEKHLPHKTKLSALRVIFLLMHSVHFGDFFGTPYKTKPTMFSSFHRNMETKSTMALKNWIQLAFVVHQDKFDFFK